MGTLMTRCTYHYWWKPGKERRLNYCIYIIGDPASGKSFAVDLDRILLAPIKQQSEEASKAINKYKREAKERGYAHCFPARRPHRRHRHSRR